MPTPSARTALHTSAASAPESESAPASAPQKQALISFLEHDVQSMIVLDPQYRILGANTAYQRHFGTSGKRHLGQPCYRVSHQYDVPCDQAGEHCPMQRARALNGPDRVLHIHHTPRGPEHVDVELRPILDESRRVVAYVERLTTVRHASAWVSADGLVGGTLFLDEMGAVPLAMQVKLLRLIESGTYRRVGGLDTLRSNFRLVAATHKPLLQMVAEGRFRQDLYYHISAFPIALPPLRDRAADIPMLVDSFLQRQPGHGGGKGGQRITVQPQAMARLQVHDWPGNIRELRNVLDRSRLFADDGQVRIEHLPDFAPTLASASPARSSVQDAGPASQLTVRLSQTDQLRQLSAGRRLSRREMARQLGLSERTLHRRLKALDPT